LLFCDEKRKREKEKKKGGEVEMRTQKKEERKRAQKEEEGESIAGTIELRLNSITHRPSLFSSSLCKKKKKKKKRGGGFLFSSSLPSHAQTLSRGERRVFASFTLFSWQMAFFNAKTFVILCLSLVARVVQTLL
jgi:hypothetical protein